MNKSAIFSISEKVTYKVLFFALLLLGASFATQADSADELYNRGYHEYNSSNYIGALKFLSAYKYHPDSTKSSPEKLKAVEKVLQFSEEQLKKCNCYVENHLGGGGGFFRGKAVLYPIKDLE